MGSDSSNTNTNNGSSKTTSKKKTVAKTVGHFLGEEKEGYSYEENKQVKQLEQKMKKLKDLESSMTKDPSISNMIGNFAEGCSTDSLEHFGEFVDMSKKSIGELSKASKHLKKVATEEQLSNLFDLTQTYLELLGKTRNAMDVSIYDCEDLKAVIARLLGLIVKESESGSADPSAATMKECTRCFSRLSEWIDTSTLKDLIADWSKMIAQSKAQSEVWKTIIADNKINKMSMASVKKHISPFSCVLSVLGTIASVAGIVVVIATGGIAGLVIGGVLMIGGALSSAISYGVTCHRLSRAQTQAKQIMDSAVVIHEALENMFKASLNMKKSLLKGDGCVGLIGSALKKVKTAEGFFLMTKGLNDLDKFLGKYAKQAEKVGSDADDAVETMIEDLTSIKKTIY